MKVEKIILGIVLAASLLTGCRRSGNEIFEDSRSCGRHMSRGVRSLGGKHGDSRQVADRDAFFLMDGEYIEDFDSPAMDRDFIPLQDEMGRPMMTMQETNYPAPKESPGDPGSTIPGIGSFRDPSTVPEMAGVFQNVYFDLNSSLIKGQQNLKVIRDVAGYMRSHPRTYIFVEGHTDERGPDAYNLALGAHRSNSVRNLLIEEGVNHDNIFTISYGKERPVMMDHHEEAWALNRRAEFKVYQR